MAMGRGCKVFHNILGPKGQLVEGQAYSLVMEQRNKNEVLMFENYAIASMRKFKWYMIIFDKEMKFIGNCRCLTKWLFFNLIIATTEFETQRKLYSKVSDAYGCLGILRIPVGMQSMPNIDQIKIISKTIQQRRFS